MFRKFESLRWLYRVTAHTYMHSASARWLPRCSMHMQLHALCMQVCKNSSSPCPPIHIVGRNATTFGAPHHGTAPFVPELQGVAPPWVALVLGRSGEESKFVHGHGLPLPQQVWLRQPRREDQCHRGVCGPSQSVWRKCLARAAGAHQHLLPADEGASRARACAFLQSWRWLPPCMCIRNNMHAPCTRAGRTYMQARIKALASRQGEPIHGYLVTLPASPVELLQVCPKLALQMFSQSDPPVVCPIPMAAILGLKSRINLRLAPSADMLLPGIAGNPWAPAGYACALRAGMPS